MTSIGNNVFSGCTDLTSIEIPASVTSIGNYAFSGYSNLTSIDIPASVTGIGEGAFNGCKDLTTVFMYSMTPPALGQYAFYIYGDEFVIYVPNDAISAYKDAWSDYESKIQGYYTCGDNVFWSYNSDSKTLTIFGEEAMTDYKDETPSPWSGNDITTIYIRDGLTSIGDHAFADCNITMISIPASVTSIGEKAFKDCSALTTVLVKRGESSITQLGVFAFKGCNALTDIYVPADKVDAYKDAWLEYTGIIKGYDGVCGDNVLCLYDSTSKTLTILGTGAMYSYDIAHTPWYDYHNEIATCVIKDGVTTIGEYAFTGCSGLTSITIPDGVTSIEWSAFADCHGLTEVTIPATVTSIKTGAFKTCSNLKTFIAQPTTPPTLGGDVFGDGYMGSLSVNIYVAADKVDAYKSAWSAYADKIQAIGGTCGEGVMWAYHGGILNIFGAGAMADYTSGNQPWAAHLAEVTKVVIDRNVTTIGKNAFRGCTNLTTLMSWATTPLTLGSDALTGCADLAHIYVPISI